MIRPSASPVLCAALALSFAAAGAAPAAGAASGADASAPGDLAGTRVSMEDALDAHDWTSAERIAHDAIDRAVAGHGEGSAQALDARDLLLEALITRNAPPEEIVALAESTWAAKRDLLGADDPRTAASLSQLGIAYDMAGQPDSAVAAMSRALAIRRAKLGPEDPEVAESLRGIGIFHVRRNELDAAADTLREAARIWEAAPGRERDVVRALIGAAWCDRRRGAREDSDAEIARAIDLAERTWGEGNERTAEVLYRHASMLLEAGRDAESREATYRALAALEDAGPVWEWLRASCYNNLGEVERSVADFPAARRWNERAVEATEKVYGADSPEYAFALDSLGLLQQAMGDLSSARRAFERVRDICERTLGPDHPQTVLAITDLAATESRDGNHELAAKLLEEAVPRLERGAGEGIDLEFALARLAAERKATGDLDGAETAIERAIDMTRRILGPGHPDLTYHYGLLAGILEAKGRTAAADSVYRECVDLTERTFGNDTPFYEEQLFHYAQFLHSSGRSLDAFRTARRVEDVSRKQVGVNATVLAEREALRYLDARSDALDLILTILEDEGASGGEDLATPAWDSVARSRCLVLDEMIARQRAAHSASDPAVQEAADACRAAAAQLAALWADGAAADEIDPARAELERAERDLAERSASWRDRRERSRAGLEDAAAGRPEDAALVAYVRYGHVAPAEDRYLAFVLSAGTSRATAVPLGPADSLEARIDAWRRSLRGPEETSRAAGVALRKALWDPVAASLGPADRRVFVVPDGAVARVSLAALPADDGGYLAESGPTFHALSSERDLAPGDRPAPGTGLLALGGAEYDASPGDGVPDVASFRGEHAGCPEFADLTFGELPATVAEIREVSDAWVEARGSGNTVRLEGARATEGAFRALAPGRRVLHLATHGFFVGAGCGGAAGGERGVAGMAPLETVAEEDPLLLSGLALAGANRRTEAAPGEDDGILTAQEIGALDLSGVEWAVLSACDTGAGTVESGEGVLGLQRAFVVAGARTVVMSLWPVRDEDARDWMVALYAARARGATTADAVREADLEVLRARRAAGGDAGPAAWGAFVAVGDWR